MVELSRTRARVSTQDRPVYRRDGVLPRQMGPDDSPQRRNQVDLGAARRGDGGAAEVLAIARQINGAFESYQRLDQQKFVYDEQQNAFKAVADEQLGTVDEGLMAESEAYRAAFSLSKIETEMAEAKPRMLEATQAVIDNYEGADLSELMSAVEQTIDSELAAILTDPETGEVRDLGTAQAFAIAANRVGTLSDQTRTDARTVARKRIAENGRTMELNRGLAEVRANGTLDLSNMFTNLDTYGLGDAQKEETLLQLIEVIDRENPAQADAIASQLLGLPTTVRSIRQPGETETVRETLPPTKRLPVQGRITAKIGDGRNHNGVDIDGQIGDPIEAPAGGRVIEVGFNNRAGKFVRIDHGNGVVSSYSHLDASEVAEGDIVRPGQTFARVGNTGNVKPGPNGDGSHLHWVVRQNGQMVDPLSFEFPAYEAESTVVTAAPVVDAPEAPKLVIPAGFRLSADGLAQLSTMREQSAERARILADRAEQETFQKNGEALYRDIVNGSWPSDQRLRTMAEAGQISWDTAQNFKTMREQNERAQRAELDRQQDRLERASNQAADMWSAQIAMDWRLGNGPKTFGEFQKFVRENSSKLGVGTNWLQNEAMLRSAFEGYQNQTTRDPEFRLYKGMVGNLFPSGSSGGLRNAFGDADMSRNTRLRAEDRFRNLVVVENKHPAEAFQIVSREFNVSDRAGAASTLTDIDNELAELARRRGN